jgi:DNA-binding CsgD family transcriptional regulator
MFGQLGTEVDQDLAYRQLQAISGCAVEDVRHVLGVQPAIAASLIEDLRSSGLVTIAGDRVEVTPPASALQRAQQVEAAEIERLHQANADSVLRLRHVIADALSTEPIDSHHVRVIRGTRAVSRELVAATILCSGEDLSTADTVIGQNPSDTGIDDDLVYAVLAHRPLRELGLRGAAYLAGGQQRRLSAASRHGGIYRCSPATPIRMEVFDRSLAFLPIDPDEPAKGAYAVRSPAVLQVLCRMFFDLWAGAEALPVLSPAQLPAGVTDLQLRVLRALADGYTDDRIARNLEVSRSTVTRAIRGLQDLLLADSRFQLAVRATREGWLQPSITSGDCAAR